MLFLTTRTLTRNAALGVGIKAVPALTSPSELDDDEADDDRERSSGEEEMACPGEVGERTRISGGSSVRGEASIMCIVSPLARGSKDNEENDVVVASTLNEPARYRCFEDAADVLAAATRGRLVLLSPLSWRTRDTESFRAWSLARCVEWWPDTARGFCDEAPGGSGRCSALRLALACLPRTESMRPSCPCCALPLLVWGEPAFETASSPGLSPRRISSS